MSKKNRSIVVEEMIFLAEFLWGYAELIIWWILPFAWPLISELSYWTDWFNLIDWPKGGAIWLSRFSYLIYMPIAKKTVDIWCEKSISRCEKKYKKLTEEIEKLKKKGE